MNPILRAFPAPLVVAGATLATSYPTSYTALPDGWSLSHASRIHFWLNIVLATGSPITSVVVKLQARLKATYSGSTVSSDWLDIFSDKGDKGTGLGTLELEHTYAALSAPIAKDWQRFFLDNLEGLIEIQPLVKVVGGAGITGDSVTIYAVPQ